VILQDGRERFLTVLPGGLMPWVFPKDLARAFLSSMVFDCRASRRYCKNAIL